MLTPVSHNFHSKSVGPIFSHLTEFGIHRFFSSEIYTKKEKSAYLSSVHGQATEANHGVLPGHHYSKP